MGTELSEPIITCKDNEDPYTKYIVHMASRLEQDSREIQTIATEDNIAEMKQVVDNALALKQTLSSIDPGCQTPCTPPNEQY